MGTSYLLDERTLTANRWLEEGELAVDEGEGLAVVGGDAILFDGGVVVLGGVAFVFVPVVLGEVLRNAQHVLVTVGLGEDGGSRNAHVGAVALDNGGVRHIAPGLEAVAVDQDVLRGDLEGVEGAVHGQDRGVEDVDAVNLLGPHHGHCPCERLMLDDGAQHFALALGELFAVVDDVVIEVGWQYHSSRSDGAGKRSAACLVASGLDAPLNQIFSKCSHSFVRD